MSDQVSGENLPATPEADQTTPVAVRKGMWSEGTGDTSGYGGLVRPLPTVTGSTPPFGSYFDAIYDRLIELVPDGVGKVVVDRGEFTLYIPREKLLQVLQTVRDDAHLRFEFCASASGVHYPHDTGAELHVAYELQSMTHNRRLRLEVTCPDSDPHVPSAVSVYPAMDWHEREAWDMFGIIFDGHPHLTRILMPDDWVGHPQRKDYPLGGIPVEFKGAVVQPVDERRSYR